jgi:hypothetical protein
LREDRKERESLKDAVGPDVLQAARLNHSERYGIRTTETAARIHPRVGDRGRLLDKVNSLPTAIRFFFWLNWASRALLRVALSHRILDAGDVGFPSAVTKEISQR